MTLHVSHETGFFTQASGRRSYRREAHGTCPKTGCNCPSRKGGRGYCDGHHAEYQRDWRIAQKAKRAEIAAGVAAMAAMINQQKEQLEGESDGQAEHRSG